MKNKLKKGRLKMILTSFGLLLVAGVVIAVALRVAVPTLIAPTAPESQPEAAEGWKHSSDCNVSFSVKLSE